MSFQIRAARFVGFAGRELWALHASAECMPRASAAPCKHSARQPRSGAFGAADFIPPTNRPAAPHRHRRKLLTSALSTRDKTSLQITGQQVAAPVCITSEHPHPAPPPRRDPARLPAPGCHGHCFPLPSRGVGDGQWLVPGVQRSAAAPEQHPQAQHPAARRWAPPLIPPSLLGSLRSVPAPRGSRSSSMEAAPSPRDKAEVSSGGSAPGMCPQSRAVPGTGSTRRGRAEGRGQQPTPFAGVSPPAGPGSHVRAAG